MSSRWDIAAVTAENLKLELTPTEAVITLLQEDNTVPFIVRYRREKTGDLNENDIRKIEREHRRLRGVMVKQESMIKSLRTSDSLSPAIEREIFQAKSLEELEEMPYRKKGKKSLAERAKELGLQPLGETIVKDQGSVDLAFYADASKEGLKTTEEVKTGVMHIIADTIAKDIDTRDALKKRVLDSAMWESTMSKSKQQDSSGSHNRKYEEYYKFSRPVRAIKSYQVLAMNRGEEQKVLSIKLSLPTQVEASFLSWCQQHWLKPFASKQAAELISAAVKDSNKRLLLPKQFRDIRRSETRKAEREAIDTFSCNLRNVLLTAPVRGATVLGIDPGYSHGCKLAVVDPTGDGHMGGCLDLVVTPVLIGRILYTAIVYIMRKRDTELELERIINRNRCTVVAIGNGKGSRETEELVSHVIKQERIWTKNVSFCVVDEAGASIYSVSTTAQKEMPDLDPNLRSAVSIARRLQDPMAELVKINPKHVGLGLYQHDMPSKQLDEAVDAVVEDAVSFVGVDLNACSEALLRRVAGMSDKRAKAVIEHRNANGAFVNRFQLKSVKSIGEKTFQQCAGFLRIHQPAAAIAESQSSSSREDSQIDFKPDVGKGRKRKGCSVAGAFSKRKKIISEFEPFDATNIHPESYEATRKLLDLVGATTKELGKQSLQKRLSSCVEHNETGVAQEIGVGVPTLQLIFEALQQPSRDIRSDFNKPIFRHSVMSMSNMSRGMILTGRVTNVVPFGAFVDVGVETAGLLHASYARGRDLKVGDSVSVMVNNIEEERGRISLALNV